MTTPSSEEKKWEKEFDKKFSIKVTIGVRSGEGYVKSYSKEIKDFIRTLIDRTHQAAIEQAKACVPKKMKVNKEMTTTDYLALAHNDCRQSTLKKLEEL